MPKLNQGIDPQLLLAQAGWVRGLAVSLLRDEHLAEDVVQETWLAALQGGPSSAAQATDGGRLRSWLAAVTRNLALNKRRNERNRSRIEADAAVPEALEPDREAERLRQARDLTEAVLALEDPYRSTLVLRYFDGLSAQAIARQRGVSPGAARQHLSRGLAMLRARFESESAREKGSWRRGLLVLAGSGGRESVAWSVVATGGSLMGVKWIVGALALAGIVAWGTLVRPGIDSVAGEEHARVTAASTAMPSRPVQTASGAESIAAPVDVVPGVAQRLAVPVPDRDFAHVTGRVLDSAGKGIAGAWIFEGQEPDRANSKGHAGSSDAFWLFRSEAATVAEDSRVYTDSKGAFDVAVRDASAMPSTLRFGCEGFLAVSMPVEPGIVMTVQLLRAPRVVGTMLDPLGQPAAPPGWVHLTVSDGQPSLFNPVVSRQVPLENDGTFAFEGLPLGRVKRLSGLVQGTPETALFPDLQLVAETTATVELQLEPGVRVIGTVVDEGTGDPIPGAEVWADAQEPDNESLRPIARADGNGTFELEGVRALRRSIGEGDEYIIVRVIARAEGYSATPTRAFAAGRQDEGAYSFEIRLPRAACGVTGRVFDPVAGTPVIGAHVHAIDSQGRYAFAQTDPEGYFYFHELPQGNFALFARHGEFQDPNGSASVSAHIMLAPGAQESVQLRLEWPGATGIDGHVVGPSGRAQTDIAVMTRLLLSANGVSVELDSKTTRTDGNGDFRLDGISPGSHIVSLEPVEGERTSSSPLERRVELESGRRAAGIDFERGPEALFSGRVVDATADLGLYRVDLYPSGEVPGSVGESLEEVEVNADGTFQFSSRIEDLYELRLILGESTIARQRVGPASAQDLELSAAFNAHAGGNESQD